MTNQPRHSVSLTLVRPRDGKFEVFWGRRHLDRSFLPGFHSFIAGSIEPGDPTDQAAALRECFEECGLLFTAEGPELFDFSRRTPETFEKLSPKMTIPGMANPPQMTTPGAVNLSTPGMVDLGWWRTPSWLHPPFITHFFALILSEEGGSKLDNLPDLLDPDEFLRGEWISAPAALERWESGQAYLTTPLTNILKLLAPEVQLQTGNSTFTPYLGVSADDAPTQEAIEIVAGVNLLPLKTATLPPATHTNSIIIGRQRFVVTDPGPDDRDSLQPLLNYLKVRIAAGHEFAGIVLTHHHRDHIGGIDLLADHFSPPLFAHQETLNRLPDYPLPTHRLNDGATLPTDCSSKFTALHTPGHAPGHLVFYQPASGLILAGDLVASEGTIIIDPPDGHMGSYLHSLHKVRALNPSAILPSHGHLIARPIELLEQYLTHRNQRESLVLHALRDQGSATAEELIPAVYPEIPRAVWPLAARSLLAHLIHLTESGHAISRNGRYLPVNTKP